MSGEWRQGCLVLYLCVPCSSFVRSVTMDRWKDSELEKMKVPDHFLPRVSVQWTRKCVDGLVCVCVCVGGRKQSS